MIFYYSKNKKTQVFAQAFGEYLHMDTLPLRCDALDQKSGLGFLVRAVASAFTGNTHPVDNMDQLPTPFPAEIYVASPIWGGRLASPVRYFLQQAPLTNTKVHLILTAEAPVPKYEKNALDFLATMQCIQGDCHLFATSSKTPPEKDVLIEQLPKILADAQLEADQHE